MRVKSLRDIRTLRGQVHGIGAKTRAQAVAELAYLEHEKARLERESKIWIANQTQMESRLQSVRRRIGQVQAMLDETPADPGAARNRRPKTGGGQPRASCCEVPLEY
ncbi:MAG: hypothetical protein Q7T82_20140 [Armatimonadota bacterium]|nr:hypothetical protein [Armatimonadota bacterium]